MRVVWTPSTLKRRARDIGAGAVIVAGASTERRVLGVTHIPRGYGDPSAPVADGPTVVIRTTHETRGQDDIRLGADETLTIVAPIVLAARAAGVAVPNVGDLVTFGTMFGTFPARVVAVHPVSGTVDIVSTSTRSGALYPRGYRLDDIRLTRLTIRRHRTI